MGLVLTMIASEEAVEAERGDRDGRDDGRREVTRPPARRADVSVPWYQQNGQPRSIQGWESHDG